jgi:hypothetical protein
VVALLADIPRITSLTEYPPPGLGPGVRSPHIRPGQPGPAVLRRRRLLAVALLVLLILAVCLSLQAALGRIGGSPLATAGAPGGSEAVSTRIWIVRPGDTLWSIAEAVDPHGDVRPLVDRLAKELRGTILHTGESVALPTR